MPCYKPIFGVRSIKETSSGKRKIVFSSSVARIIALGESFPTDALVLPCGQCIGCRLSRARDWAIRCHCESSLYDSNCFITLTYSPESLPSGGTLVKKHFQDFMKRLRKRFGKGVRYYHCGEYGERFQRPHYHACLFNFDLPDRKLWRIDNGQRLYTSEILADLWTHGFCTVGDVTFESAGYVARYITKKIYGDPAKDHYDGRLPEYTTMSRRPGIGKMWLDKYMTDVFPQDSVVIRGREMPVPKYFDKQYEIAYPEDFERIKLGRLDDFKDCEDDFTLDRLAVKSKKKYKDMQLLVRKFEKG